MPTRNPEHNDAALLTERQRSWRSGMDAWRPASELPPDGTVRNLNVVVASDGSPRTRAGLRAFDESFVGPTEPRNSLVYFDTPEIEALLVFTDARVWGYYSVGGLTGWTPITMTGAPTNFPAAGSRVVAVQGLHKLLVTDGTNNCATLEYTGSAWVWTALADADGQPPAGTRLLCWTGLHPLGTGGTFRMLASGVDGYEDTIWVSDLLNFGPGAWNRTAFSFRVGEGDGQRITCLASAQAQTVVVGKAASIYLVSAPAQAASAADYNIELLTASTGIANGQATCRVGNDVLAVCSDGHIRSIGRMQSAEGQFEISEPLSVPLTPYIERINWEAAEQIQAIAYQQLALFALPLDDSEEATTILVWDGRLRAWVGVWEGWSVRDWCVSRFNDAQRLLVLPGAAMGATSWVGVWADYRDRDDPETFEDFGTTYATAALSRALNFGDPEQEKDLLWIEAQVRASFGAGEVAVYADETELATRTLPFEASYVDLNDAPAMPFELPVPRLQTIRRGLSHLRHGQEFQLEFRASSGCMELKRWSLAALPGMLRGA